MGKINSKIKTVIRNYLEIKEPQGLSINIEQVGSHDVEVFKSNIWYRGEANELDSFYKQIDHYTLSNHFWGSSPTTGCKIRKIHTGLPSLIVEVLTRVCTDDLYSVKLSARQAEWDETAEENNFLELVAQCVSDVLVQGDGAFKLSYDPEISALPIIEFFPAERVEYEYERGRLTCIIFKTKKTVRGKTYTLNEYYGEKTITYTVTDSVGDTVDKDAFPEFKKYKDIINLDSFIPAVKVMITPSKKHKGRGKSIFAAKYDNFDSFDEVFSQWMLAVRKGQIKEYVPESLLPRDPETGEVIEYNYFDNDYIYFPLDMREGSTNKIETTQGQIQYEALLSSYVTALDLCLQGIISPSTLGIDVKKLDNAEAQREKEKTTLYTRNAVIGVLNKVIPELVIKTLKFIDNLNQTKGDEPKVTVNFGGYANPSFEAQVETVGKAGQYGIMSVETSVEELYGDTKDEKWKAEEVKRLKYERGILETEEPAVNADAVN